jgi:hypothetical protein
MTKKKKEQEAFDNYLELAPDTPVEGDDLQDCFINCYDYLNAIESICLYNEMLDTSEREALIEKLSFDLKRLDEKVDSGKINIYGTIIEVLKWSLEE